MDNKTGIICPECGRANAVGSAFCAYCGIKLSKPSGLVCPSCGTQCSDDMRFCPSCGRRLMRQQQPQENPPVHAVEDTGTAPAVTAEVPKQEKKRSVHELYQKHEKLILLVRDAFLVVLCALLCLFAFLPVLRVDKDACFARIYELCEDTVSDKDGSVSSERKEVQQFEQAVRKLEINFSVMDYIRFAVKSFGNMDTKDLEDSAEYKELEELSADLSEKIEKEIGDAEDGESAVLSQETVNLMRKVVNRYLQLSYSSEKLPGSAQVTVRVAAVVGASYLLLSVILLILAVLNFIGRWIHLRSFVRPTLTVLSVMPILLAGLLYAVGRAMDTVVSAGWTSGSSGGYGSILVFGAEKTAVAGIVMSAVTLVAAFAFSLFGRSRREFLRTIPRVLAATVAVGAVIGVCNLPILTEEASVVPKNRENTTTVTLETDAGLYAGLFLTESEQKVLARAVDQTKQAKIQAFAEYFGEYGFGSYTKSQLNDGYADHLNDDFLYAGLLIGGQYEQGVVYLRLAYFLPFILIAFAAMLVAATTFIQLGGQGRGAVGLSKAMMLLTAIGMLACSIILMFVVRNTFDHYAVTDYTVSVGFAPIFLLACSVLLLFFPVKEVKRQE